MARDSNRAASGHCCRLANQAQGTASSARTAVIAFAQVSHMQPSPPPPACRSGRGSTPLERAIPLTERPS